MVDNIKPEHYRTGEIDLYESWYRTYPFNEYRAIMQAVAERYMRRDKNDRVEDINKAIYTLERLREKELEHAKKNEKKPQEAFNDMAKVLGGFGIKIAGEYLYESYLDHEDLLEKLLHDDYRYLARDEDGELFAYATKPEKEGAIWTTYIGDFVIVKVGDCEIIRNDTFPKIKWEDEGPTKISDLLEEYKNGGENGN